MVKKKNNICPIRQRFLFILLYSIFAVSACSERQNTVVITIQRAQNNEPITIHVETAITPAEQQRGFMHREHIPDGTGMLFIYKKDIKLQFWMKNTPHPLSIAFIDSKGRICEIKDMQPYSLAVISSTYSVRYALEVPQGYFERAHISVGDSLAAETLRKLQKQV